MRIENFDRWCRYMYEENCLERHRNGLEAYESKEAYVKLYKGWLERKHEEHMRTNNWSESIYLS